MEFDPNHAGKVLLEVLTKPDVLKTILILMLPLMFKDMIVRFFSSRFTIDEERKLVEQIIPSIIPLFVIGLLIYTWVDKTNFFIATIYLGLFLLGAKNILSVVEKSRRKADKTTKKSNLFNYLVSAVGLIVLLKLVFSGLTPTSLNLGLVLVALAIAGHNILGNICGWLMINGKPLFRVGQTIAVGEHKGEVLEITNQYFTVRPAASGVGDGNSPILTVRVPNNLVFKTPIVKSSMEGEDDAKKTV